MGDLVWHAFLPSALRDPVTCGPLPPVECVTTLQRGFPEAAVHCLAQQNPGTNVADADNADVGDQRMIEITDWEPNIFFI